MNRQGAVFGIFVLIVVAIIVAPNIIDLTSTDTDEHGTVAVPGQATLDLPDGEVGLYYGERRKMPSQRRGNALVPDSLPVPRLDLRITPAGGGDPLPTSFAEGTQVGGTKRTTRQFAVVDVPEDGDYKVTVRSEEPIRFPEPRLSFGTDSSEDTEWGPSEWLLDHIRTVILIGVGVMILAQLAPRFMPRRGGDPPPPPPVPPPADDQVKLRL